MNEKKMEEVREFLQEVSLTIYADTFEEQGYDSLQHLLAMGPKELQELQNLIKMRPGHFARLQLAIEERGGPVTPSTASTPMTPMSSASADLSPESDAYADMAPMTMGPNIISGPNGSLGPNGLLGPNLSIYEPLKQVYAKWAQARLVSERFSTNLGCSCMLDNKSSGGRRKILRCRTVLSKKRKRTTDEQPCEHMLLWTKDRTGNWKLNLEKSHLHHIPFCNSGQNITMFQLVNDPKFVRSQHLGKLSTGKAAATLALGDNGRLAGAVKDHTARRARNTLKHYNATDYDDDWSKLNEWGHKFMEINPQSRFHLEKDEENRLVILSIAP